MTLDWMGRISVGVAHLRRTFNGLPTPMPLFPGPTESSKVHRPGQSHPLQSHKTQSVLLSGALYNSLKEQREKTVQKLLNAEGKSLRGDRAVEAQLKLYEEAKMKTEGSSQVQTFLGSDQSGDNVRIMEGLTCEFIFYDNLISEIPRNDELDSQLEFYEKLKSLHKDVFGKDVDIHQRVDYLTTSSFENIRPSQRGNQASDLRNNNRPPTQSIRSQKPDYISNSIDFENQKDDYDYDMRSKSPNMNVRDQRNSSPEGRNEMKFTLGLEENGIPNNFPDPLSHLDHPNESYARSQQSPHRPPPMVPENRPNKTLSKAKLHELQKQNDRLKTDINDLSLIREDLEHKIEQSFANQSKINSSAVITNLRGNPETQSLLERKNKKEMEIEDLKQKIQRLETQDNRDDTFDDIGRRGKAVDTTANKHSRTRSQIYLEKDLTHNSRVLGPPKRAFVKTAEKSGSTFVNQMMTDISRVLSRGSGSAGLSPNISMARSYYINQ